MHAGRRYHRRAPLVGRLKKLLRNRNDARKVRDLRRPASIEQTNSMKPSFHIAANTPSRKRDAGLRACERQGALLPSGDYFGSPSID